MNIMRIITSLCLVLVFIFSGCMSGEQRYKLHKDEMTKRYSQERLYQPLVVNSEGGIEFKGKTSFTVNVPLEQLEGTPIPDDLKTMSDLIQWGIGAGLIGYGIHEVGRANNSKTINNNASSTETP